MAALPFIAGGLLIAGAVTSAMAKNQEGKDAKAQAEFEANVAEENAQIATANAAEEERRIRILGKKVLGGMKADYAASGVDVGQSSAMNVLAESAGAAELDALTARYEGQLQAREYRMQAQSSRMKGESARRAGKNAALSSVLGGMGSVAGFMGGGAGGKSA